MRACNAHARTSMQAHRVGERDSLATPRRTHAPFVSLCVCEREKVTVCVCDVYEGDDERESDV